MKKECYKQYRYVKCKGTMTKWPVQKPTHRTTRKHVKHYDATDILKKNYFFVLTLTHKKNYTQHTKRQAFCRLYHQLHKADLDRATIYM